MIRDQDAHEVGGAGKLKGSNVAVWALYASEDGLISRFSARLLEIAGGDRVSDLSASIGGSFSQLYSLHLHPGEIRPHVLHVFIQLAC